MQSEMKAVRYSALSKLPVYLFILPSEAKVLTEFPGGLAFEELETIDLPFYLTLHA